MKTLLTISTLALLATGVQAATTVVTVPRGGTGDQANFAANAGQTFTTGTLGTDLFLSTIDLVGPNTAGGTDPVGPFTVKLWTDIDGDAETWDPGVEVAVSLNTITIPVGNGTVTANFGNDLLVDNTVYLLSFTNGSTDHAEFRMGLSAPEAGGPLGTSGKLFSNEANPAFGDNRELAFTVTTIPEPSSALLGGIGLLAFLRRKR